VATYGNVHLVLLMWIHLDVLVVDDPCPEVDGLRDDYASNEFDLDQMSFCSYGL
jgi:hypothetical protein